MDAAWIPRPAREMAPSIAGLAESLFEAGVRLIQYRNKTSSARLLFQTVHSLVGNLGPRGLRVIVNDRPDVAAVSGAAGVHVGQQDLRPEEARKNVGVAALIGLSTHTLDQVREADAGPADYIAIGPIFPTQTKQIPDPAVGVEFVRRARALTSKPLVAIGGITLARAGKVWAAGADAVAVAGDILGAEEPREQARRYLELAERRN